MSRERKSVDFHIHSRSGEQEFVSGMNIIDAAAARNVVAIGLLGRSELPDNYGELERYGQQKGVEVFIGVEGCAMVGEERADFVFLGFSETDPTIQKLWGKEENIQRNVELANRQVDLLESKGFRLRDDHSSTEARNLLVEVLSGKVGEKAIRICQAAVLISSNAATLDDLKAAHLQKWRAVQTKHGGKPFYQDNPNLLEAKFLYELYFDFGTEGRALVEPEDINVIAKTVRDAGGVVLYSPEGRNGKQVLDQLLEQAIIDGVMGWHAGRLELSKSEIKRIKKAGLIILGGSDFDPKRDHWQIGTGDGSMFISPRRLDELKQVLNSQ